MDKRENAAQVSGGVFLVGIGMLFLTGWWWPGVLFVGAATMIARTLAEGRPLRHAKGAFWMIGFGILFSAPELIGTVASSFWQFFPLILIVIGLFMVFGGRYRPTVDDYDDEKPKNDDDDDVY